VRALEETKGQGGIPMKIWFFSWQKDAACQCFNAWSIVSLL